VLYNVQFRWRLHGYVLLATAILVMFVLTWPASSRGRRARATTVALLAIVALNVGVATWQVWQVRSEYVEHGREVTAGSSFVDTVVAARAVEPPSWYDGGDDFRDVSTPIVATAPGRVLVVPEVAVHGSSFSGVLDVPDGAAPFATNISAGSRFVRMTGIRAVGRTRDGSIVAVRAPGVSERGPVPIAIEQNATPVLRAGALVALVSAAAVGGLLAWLVLDALRRRRRARPTPGALEAEPVPQPSERSRQEPVPV
jgi:hypothetical protein